MSVTPPEPMPTPAEEAGVFSIYSMMETIMERIVAGYENLGVSLPDRRYLGLATPAVDCEQLVVVFRQAYYGPPGDEASEPQRCDGIRTAVIEVQLWRCIPVPKGGRQTAPSATTLQEGLKPLLGDAWLLLDLAPDTESWNGAGPGGIGVIATVEATEAQGAYQGVVLTLTMAIPGE